ncbi:transcriptional repressor [Nisaea acidiphila]|uniref:Ferric uptake regulation protein n=1 Tax=Nisaea acidiphila TaxID=1862145 RepID=A0A9J7ARC9_9PROT|nr:transcriptional repressor [Nisaea acidiphila]UUX48900.1 transcriptional repressor [Nisaea acidiphila]
MTSDVQANSKRVSNHLRVLRILRQSNGPLTAYQILNLLRKHGISGPTTVYRALDRLIESGQVHRIESLNAYVICSNPGHRSAAGFVICDRCGGVSEFFDAEVEARLRQLAEDLGFGIRAGNIEVRGKCGDCLALPRKAGAQL